MTRQKSEAWEWIKALAIAVLLAGAIRYFLFAPIVVDGLSMMPTLHDQNKMIVNKFSYQLGEPKRFDIVVFHAPEEKDYIKRIIGLPGDHVSYKNDVLYINGEPVEEPYLQTAKNEIVDSPLTYDFELEELTGQNEVPDGHLFVMGDNRRFSKDSRSIGFVPMDKVIGKTGIVFWPISEFRIVE
ncbi:signal peptidase I [Bacillus salitolerans]|uniref:Signal peptidase I n=1 Tax=Bacillus salitolerans TaxID=1437434 RepID=A0ABW4LL09_9BACI